MQIGEKLKQKRNEAGWSQEVLAEKIGVSRQTVSNWETNRSYPDIGSVLRLSDLYGISLDELLKEDTNMRKHVEETAKLPMRWWKILYGVAIALVPLSTLLNHWGIGTTATVLKYISLFLLPVLAFTRWKLNGGKKTEVIIMIGLWCYFLLSELLGGIVSTTWLGVSIEVFLLMGYLLIYGYGSILGKGLIFWLMIFLYFGTPVYFATEAIFPNLQSMEAIEQVELYGNYEIEEVLYGTEGTSGRQIAIWRDDAQLWINGESIGYLQYTKPLDNQYELYAVWQLVPENSPNTLYRFEVDLEMNRFLSLQVDGQLQWRWQLRRLPDFNMNP